MLRITLPANADLSIFDDILRRDELVKTLQDCGLNCDKETLSVRAEKPVDLLAIVAEHIREQDNYPAGGVWEEPGDDGIIWQIHLKVANRGLIMYKDQGPELNLMDPFKDEDLPKGYKKDDDRWSEEIANMFGFTVNRVVRPEDPDFFDQIEDWIQNTVLKGWGSVQV
jgi:hypothetical protein